MARSMRRGFSAVQLRLVALAVAIPAILFPPAGGFVLPRAAVADALTRTRTLFIEREVQVLPRPELGIRRWSGIERIWFRAPASLRIEYPNSVGTTLAITRPGEFYRTDGIRSERFVGVRPEEDPLPESLSPTIALIGGSAGSGPTLFGHPTTKYVVDFGGGRRREAFVDTTHSLFLETHEFLLFPACSPLKEVIGGRLSRVGRVSQLRVNKPLADSLFAIPRRLVPERNPEPFHTRPPSAIPGAPLAVPSGFHVVQAGTTPQARAVIQYARGAMVITVRIGFTPGGEPGPTEVRRRVRVRSLPATLSLDLYALPRIDFRFAGRDVSIVAPLPPAQLAELAGRMYPA